MIPLLFVPIKNTDQLDFKPSFDNHILKSYQVDPTNYSSQIIKLNNYRSDLAGLGLDVNGRDILYRYYGQLELLTLRFPIDEDQVKIEFTWYDAFSSKKVSQYSVAFEKASILFNLGALCTSIAASQDRSQEQGVKTAYNYLQVAAGLFQYINDNFLHPPSVDLSRDSIILLVDLCLAQSQECFIEKLLKENKSGAMIAKLANHVASLYTSVLDGTTNPALKGQFERSWLDLIKVKASHFIALANYHRSIQAEKESEYGLILTYLNNADKHAKETAKLASSFVSSFSKLSKFFVPSTTNESDTNSFAQVSEFAKEFAKTVTDRLAIATKDNDVIYNATPPAIESLPPIDKLNAVKKLSFHDLLPNGQKDLATIIGPDLFEGLVPMGVHESSSLYSEQMASILRQQQELVETADSDLHVTIESLDMISKLETMKSAIDESKHGLSNEPPSELLDSILTITKKETGFKSLLQFSTHSSANTNVSDLRKQLGEIIAQLDQEQHETEQNRLKYGKDWTLEPSIGVNQPLRKEWKQLESDIEQYSRQNQMLMTKIVGLSNFLNLVIQPKSEIVNTFKSSLDSRKPKHKQRRASLIDEVVENENQLGDLGEQIAIQKIEGILTSLRNLKNDRTVLLKELRHLVHHDDIQKVLLLNPGHESVIFKNELAKFKPFETKLETNIQHHETLLQDVSNLFQKLVKESETLLDVEIVRDQKDELIHQWGRDISTYYELDALRHQLETNFSKFQVSIPALNDKVRGFINKRINDRQSIIHKLEGKLAESSQRALQTELNRLSITSPTHSLQPPAGSPLGNVVRPTYSPSFASPAFSSPGGPQYPVGNSQMGVPYVPGNLNSTQPTVNAFPPPNNPIRPTTPIEPIVSPVNYNAYGNFRPPTHHSPNPGLNMTGQLPPPSNYNQPQSPNQYRPVTPSLPPTDPYRASQSYNTSNHNQQHNGQMNQSHYPLQQTPLATTQSISPNSFNQQPALTHPTQPTYNPPQPTPHSYGPGQMAQSNHSKPDTPFNAPTQLVHPNNFQTPPYLSNNQAPPPTTNYHQQPQLQYQTPRPSNYQQSPPNNFQSPQQNNYQQPPIHPYQQPNNFQQPPPNNYQPQQHLNNHQQHPINHQQPNSYQQNGFGQGLNQGHQAAGNPNHNQFHTSNTSQPVGHYSNQVQPSFPQQQNTYTQPVQGHNYSQPIQTHQYPTGGNQPLPYPPGQHYPPTTAQNGPPAHFNNGPTQGGRPNLLD
ncbi:BRO1-like domain-containing protein [Globomyces pollinis-pini]|nr:BRO1-like domain-containing protein [Globomyces pollinis-pini]